jgi:uncharacterized circularly permuted ATP-grasp superfamily protein
MYCYVARMIEFYLGEHAILNNVITYMLRDQGGARLWRLRHADRAGLDRRGTRGLS